MALPDLHKFERDLKNRPGPGSNAPPVSIRAKDLDENYKKVTLVQSNVDPPLYDLEYTKDGTRLTRLLPDGIRDGDLLYWNIGVKKWQVLPAVANDTLHILGIKTGVLQWVETQDCP